MVNISHNIPVFHVFVTFMSKSTVTMRGSREIQEVLPDSLKKADGSLLSLANIGDEDDPKLVILPLAIPIPVGWHIPIGHKVNKALPPSKGKATCGGTLFGPDQFHQLVNSKVENNYDKICNKTGELLRLPPQPNTETCPV